MRTPREASEELVIASDAMRTVREEREVTVGSCYQVMTSEDITN
jgi:hypothetical protein